MPENNDPDRELKRKCRLYVDGKSTFEALLNETGKTKEQLTDWCIQLLKSGVTHREQIRERSALMAMFTAPAVRSFWGIKHTDIKEEDLSTFSSPLPLAVMTKLHGWHIQAFPPVCRFVACA